MKEYSSRDNIASEREQTKTVVHCQIIYIGTQSFCLILALDCKMNCPTNIHTKRINTH